MCPQDNKMTEKKTFYITGKTHWRKGRFRDTHMPVFNDINDCYFTF